MNIKIEKTPLKQGQVRIISSKSDGHRSLIAAALAEEESVLFVDGWSEDMEATARCLQSLGAEIEREPSGIYVMPIGCPLPCPVDRIGQANGQLCILDCGESGSTLRFLLPIAGALGKHCRFAGKGRLPERPIGVLLDEMARHGCEADGDHLPVTLEGKLTAGVYTLPGNVSSQFITGLLFALPLLEGESEIRLTTKIESKGYIDMTLKTLKAFGVKPKAAGASPVGRNTMARGCAMQRGIGAMRRSGSLQARLAAASAVRGWIWNLPKGIGRLPLFWRNLARKQRLR